MGIFGALGPQFIYDYEGAGEVTVDLEHSVIVRLSPRYKVTEHREELTGERVFTHVCTHWEVVFRVYLSKFGNPLAVYNQIVSYKGRSVSLWLHSDGEPFMKSLTDTALFTITEVEHRYTTDMYTYDECLLTFRSLDPCLTVTSFDKKILVFELEPGYSGKEYYFPFVPSDEFYFLYPLADDKSYVQITERDQSKFVVSGAMDGGRVKVLFVDSSINNDVAANIRIGYFTANSTGPLSVGFSSDLPAADYFPLLAANDPVGTVVTNPTVSGFEVQTDMESTTGIYLAVSRNSDLHVGNTFIKCDTTLLDDDDQAEVNFSNVNFGTDMPNDDYWIIGRDVTTRESVNVINITAESFTLVAMAATSAYYLAIGRSLVVHP